MKLTNLEIAKQLNQVADRLERRGSSPFQVQAYRKAASVVTRLKSNIFVMVKNNQDLTTIPGIGKTIASQIKIFIKTGKMFMFKTKPSRVPELSKELLQIEGLGPKRVKVLWQHLNIHNLMDLEKAIISGQLRQLPGFNAKIEKKILFGLRHTQKIKKELRLNQVMPIAEAIVAYLKKYPIFKKIDIAGSYRRRQETVENLVIIAIVSNSAAAKKYFLTFPEIKIIFAEESLRVSVLLLSGIHVEFHIKDQTNYGATLLHFTGSTKHLRKLTKIAANKNFQLNLQGLFQEQKCIAAKTENEIYEKLNLSYIAPELREDRGEIAAAKKGTLPQLITLADIRGDLHSHTYATDGNTTIAEMAEAAALLGYEYLAITDHTKRLKITHGLNEKQLLEQIKMIDKLNARLKNFVILKSTECDILEDGSLDLPNNVLKECDLVIGSLHSKFKLSEEKQTTRILRAMDNPYFNILGHPTGRLINTRKPYEINLEKIMQMAKQRGIFLELNAQPSRLDLADIYCQMAKRIGVKIAISTDAHSTRELNFMKYGIFQARRGWLEAKDVINTRSLDELTKLLKNSRLY